MSINIGRILKSMIHKGSSDIAGLSDEILRHNKTVAYKYKLLNALWSKSTYILSSTLIAALLYVGGARLIDAVAYNYVTKKEAVAHINAGNYETAHHIFKDVVKLDTSEELSKIILDIHDDIDSRTANGYINKIYNTSGEKNLSITKIRASRFDTGADVLAPLEKILADDHKEYAVMAMDEMIAFFHEDEEFTLNIMDMNYQLVKTDDPKTLILASEEGQIYNISLSYMGGDSSLYPKLFPTLRFLRDFYADIGPVTSHEWNGEKLYFFNTTGGNTIGMNKYGIMMEHFEKAFHDEDDYLLPVKFGDVDADSVKELITYWENGITIYETNGSRMSVQVDAFINNDDIYGIEAANITGVKNDEIIVLGENDATVINFENTIKKTILTDYKAEGPSQVLHSKPYDRIAFINDDEKIQYINGLEKKLDIEPMEYVTAYSIENIAGSEVILGTYGKVDDTNHIFAKKVHGKTLLDTEIGASVLDNGLSFMSINGKNYFTSTYPSAILMLGSDWLNYFQDK